MGSAFFVFLSCLSFVSLFISPIFLILGYLDVIFSHVWWPFWCLFWVVFGGPKKGDLDGCMDDLWKGGWVCPSIRVEPPRGSKPVVPRTVAPSFWGLGVILVIFLRGHFSTRVFHRFFLLFGSQHEAKKVKKSMKNWCWNAFRHGRRFFMDFWWISALKPAAPTPKIIEISFVLKHLSDWSVFVLRCVSASTLVPTSLHFGIKTGPKSTKKTIKKDINKLIDFW